MKKKVKGFVFGDQLILELEFTVNDDFLKKIKEIVNFFSNCENLVESQNGDYYKALTLMICMQATYNDVISENELEYVIQEAEGYYPLEDVGCEIIYYQEIQKPNLDDFNVSLEE